MKLLNPFVVGDIVRTNYNTGPYRIIAIHADCTCASYLDEINCLGGKPPARPTHLHFTLVDADEPVTKSGKYGDGKCSYLNGYTYTRGECVSVDGPHEKGTSCWHKKDNGLDKIILVKCAAPVALPPLKRPSKHLNHP